MSKTVNARLDLAQIVLTHINETGRAARKPPKSNGPADLYANDYKGLSADAQRVMAKMTKRLLGQVQPEARAQEIDNILQEVMESAQKNGLSAEEVGAGAVKALMGARPGVGTPTEHRSEVFKKLHRFLKEHGETAPGYLALKSLLSAEGDILGQLNLLASLLPRVAKLKVSSHFREAIDHKLIEAINSNRVKPDLEDWFGLVEKLPFTAAKADRCRDMGAFRTKRFAAHLGHEHEKRALYTALKVRRRKIKAGQLEQAKLPILVGYNGVGRAHLATTVGKAMGKVVELSLRDITYASQLTGTEGDPGLLLRKIAEALPDGTLVLKDVDHLFDSMQNGDGQMGGILAPILQELAQGKFSSPYLNCEIDVRNLHAVATTSTYQWDWQPFSAPISVWSYTPAEQRAIARANLIEKACQEAGVDPKLVNFTDETLKELTKSRHISAGVDELANSLNQIVLALSSRIEREGRIDITPQVLKELSLGSAPYVTERHSGAPGTATGLGFLEYSGTGDTLVMEAMAVPRTSGGPEFEASGQLGESMRESAKLAYDVVKKVLATSQERIEQKSGRKITTEAWQRLVNNTVKLHVLPGAIGKDGPSAGGAFAAAIYSLLTGAHTRTDTTLTGELSPEGDIMPIGGLAEKILGAKRAGFTRVLIPEGNRHDLEDIMQRNPGVADGVEVIPVAHVRQVFEHTMDFAATRRAQDQRAAQQQRDRDFDKRPSRRHLEMRANG